MFLSKEEVATVGVGETTAAFALAARLVGVGEERERADEETKRVLGLLASVRTNLEVLLNISVLQVEIWWERKRAQRASGLLAREPDGKAPQSLTSSARCHNARGRILWLFQLGGAFLEPPGQYSDISATSLLRAERLRRGF